MDNLKPTQNLQPFRHFCMSIGVLPTSYLESLSYAELLYWFCDYLKNTVIPTINNNSDCVKELQENFISFTDTNNTNFKNFTDLINKTVQDLENFINNYFTNLDVQTEINNKLDSMAQSGQLQEIITNYLKIKGMLVFDNVNDMISSNNLIVGSYAKTCGYYAYNDGGNGFYKIRLKKEDDVDNGGTIIFINNNLVAELIFSDFINILQFGAKNDGIYNNDSSFNNAFSSTSNLYIPSGNYYFTKATINNNINIFGNGCLLNGYIDISDNCSVSFKNLSFKNLDSRALYINSSIVKVINCNFDNITLNKDNLSSYGCIYANSNNFNLTVKNCTFSNNHGYGCIYCYGSGNISISDNTFNSPDFRAIHCSSSDTSNNIISGSISNNSIFNCGFNNISNSGVGCNGIYAPNGFLLDVINNTIKKTMENAIEGNFKSIIGNIIEDTNFNLDSHPTPSIEGIFISSGFDNPCVIKNNFFNNIKRRGISCVQISNPNNKNLIISDNIINMQSYNNSLGNSIYLQGNTINNKILSNNIVNAPILISSPGNNIYYNDDINKLSDISYFSNGSTPNFKDSFINSFTNINNLHGFSYTNCNPSIVNDGTFNSLQIEYQEYNKLLSPNLIYNNRCFIIINLLAKGDFELRLYNGNTYISTINSFSLDNYTNIYIPIKSLNIKNTDSYHFRILVKQNKVLNLVNFNYSVLLADNPI